MKKYNIEKNEIVLNVIKGKIEQFAHFLQTSDMKEYIQTLLINPFLNYIVGRVFPYMIIAFCLFGLLILLIVTILIIMLRQPRYIHCTFCGK